MKKIPALNLAEPTRQFQQIMFVLFQFGEGEFLHLCFLLDFVQKLLAAFTKFRILLVTFSVKACDNAFLKGGIKGMSRKEKTSSPLTLDLCKQFANEAFMFRGVREKPDAILQAGGTCTLHSSPHG